jgi:ADP-heptose:LPS heptosyltransferase
MGECYDDILVVDLLGGLGDLLIVLPAVHALARRHPDARLRVLTHEPGADLLRSDPAVGRVLVPGGRGPGSEREAVAAAVAARVPDLAVSTTRYDGIPALLAPSRRSVDDLWRDPPGDEPVGDRYLRILHAEGLIGEDDLGSRPRVVLSPPDVARGEAVAARVLGDERAGPPVVLVPGAGMAVKQWPRGAWERLARALGEEGHHVLAVAPARSGQAPLPATRLPTLGLRELSAVYRALAARGGVAVGGDTGPVRLAAASGMATVVLFGPTSAARYAVPGARNLQGLPRCGLRRPTSIAEQVCWWDAACPLSVRAPACMADLRWQEVAHEVRAASQRARGAPVC